MFVFKTISKNVFDFSITIDNKMSVFSFNLFNRFNAMRFFRHFDLFDMKESNEKTKIFILYKKKVDKIKFVNWKFSNESKSFEENDWKISIIVEKRSRKFHLFRMNFFLFFYFFIKCIQSKRLWHCLNLHRRFLF